MNEPSNNECVVRTEGLTKKYGDFLALDDLDIRIHKGEVFGYIGPNGAGKTTTFRLLAGLLKPSAGRAYVGNLDVTESSEKLKTLVGYLPDRFGVYEGMRVWEYLDFFGAAFRISKKIRRERIDQILEATQTVDFRDKMMEALSHGMRQRVGIARTLIHGPEVLILDEPANGLDPQSRIEMRALLRNLADMGKAVLVSSHILPELASVCDRVGILGRGKLLACGPVAEIMKEIRQARLLEFHLLEQADRAAKLIEEAHPKWEPTLTDPEAGILRYQATADDREIAEMVVLLVNHNIPLLWSREEEPDLEDAFMALTQKK